MGAGPNRSHVNICCNCGREHVDSSAAQCKDKQITYTTPAKGRNQLPLTAKDPIKKHAHTNQTGKRKKATKPKQRKLLSKQDVPVNARHVSAIDEAEDIDEIEKRLEMELRGLQLLMDQYSQADSSSHPLSNFTDKAEPDQQSKHSVYGAEKKTTKQSCKQEVSGGQTDKKSALKSPINNRMKVEAAHIVSTKSRDGEYTGTSDNASRISAQSSDSRHSKPQSSSQASLPLFPAEVLLHNKMIPREEDYCTGSNVVSFPPINLARKPSAPDSGSCHVRRKNKHHKQVKEISGSAPSCSEAGVRHKNSLPNINNNI